MIPGGVRHSRWGVTVLELLIVVGVIGVLASLVLPAVNAAREAARKITCSSNLHQMGVAFQQHHNAQGVLPAAWAPAARSTSVYGWTVALLPFLEQSDLHDRLDRNLPITATSSIDVRETSLAGLLCPSDISSPTFPLYLDDDDEEEQKSKHSSVKSRFKASPALRLLVTLPTANYVGVFGTLEPDDEYPAPPGDGSVIADRPVRFADLRRGLSKTLIVGERTMAMVPSTWLGVDILGEDATCRLVGAAMTKPNCTECDECEFASRHPGGVQFLWADGHVGVLANDISSDEYRQLARRR